MRASGLWAAIALAVGLGARADVRVVVPLPPGGAEEAAAVAVPGASRVTGGARRTDKGAGWTYAVTMPPEARVTLRYRVSGEPVVTVLSAAGAPISARVERGGDLRLLYATVPPAHPPGKAVRIQFAAPKGPISVSDLRLELLLPDRNRNGIADSTERLMGVPAGRSAFAVPQPDRPRTSFQTGPAYSPEAAVPADLALVYSDQADTLRSWAEQGYTVYSMGGFRDGPEYAKANPQDLQTDSAGNPITIGGSSYYLVPSENRMAIARAYYSAALRNGAQGICPEEPEYFARAGYSDSFKKEWQARYGAPWQPPHTNVDTRWKSEQLKGFLERRMIETILEEARKTNPAAVRMAAVHSPVTYADWRIVCPHSELIRLPALQELIGQVWTGTARTPVRVGGVRAERTFELGFLEYSSLFHLSRGTGKRLWFLMDPVEDTPGLPLEDYRVNYEKTLLAALMFPGVDSYEVMPWPQRIYGQVSPEYATQVNTVVGILSDLWRYPDARLESGSTGISTFFSDSMQWQRAEPSPSDFDGFYGLCLPLVARGAPVDVLSLERAAEPGYLDSAKALLLSYDFLKPAGPEVNAAIAAWVRKGGSLVVFGGTDAYSSVSDSWWRRTGFATPLEHLFDRLGLAVRDARTYSAVPLPEDGWQVLLEGDARERNLRNRKLYTVDVSPLVRADGTLAVRFSDLSPEDGWGPLLASLELKINGRVGVSFKTGTELETRFMAEDRGSRHNGQGRFADGNASWTYRLEGIPRDAHAVLSLDIGNGFRVSARGAAPPPPLLESTEHWSGALFSRLRVPQTYPITLYTPPAGATPLYRPAGEERPAVWEARVDSGTILYAGVAPGFLTSTALASRWIRAIARRAMERAGAAYVERPYFRIRRGPIVAVRTLDEPHRLSGRYVNLLDPDLVPVANPEIPADGRALYRDLGPETGAPRLIAASGRVRATYGDSRSTAFIVQAPAGTNGTARLWRGAREAQAVRAYTLLGESLAVSAERQGDTILVRYPNHPRGAVLRVLWR